MLDHRPAPIAPPPDNALYQCSIWESGFMVTQAQKEIGLANIDPMQFAPSGLALP